MNNTSINTPFSLALLASTVLRPFMFRYPIQVIVDLLAAVIHQRHPNILERLEAFKGMQILAIPMDMPFRLLFLIQESRIAVRVIKNKDDDAIQADATIRSSLASLLQLLEGKMDGDALFFSRELTIEDNTEIIVAIRNAFDSENIDLAADILSFLGPFAKPTHFVGRQIETALKSIMADIEKIRQAWTRPVQKQCDTASHRILELNQRLTTLEKDVNRTKRYKIKSSSR